MIESKMLSFSASAVLVLALLTLLVAALAAPGTPAQHLSREQRRERRWLLADVAKLRRAFQRVEQSELVRQQHDRGDVPRDASHPRFQSVAAGESQGNKYIYNYAHQPQNSQDNQLIDFKDCYNWNKLTLRGGEAPIEISLCTALTQSLTEPYENEEKFRLACIEFLGEACTNECIDLANLFDTPQYNPDPNNPISKYGISFGNQWTKYVLLFEDCKLCLEDKECYHKPDMPQLGSK